MADIELNKTGTVNGSGTKSIAFGWGRNTSRSSVARTYSIDGGKNSLKVTQDFKALNNTYNGSRSKNVVLGGSVTFSGTANGRYLMFSGPSGLTVRVTEASGSTPQNVSTSYTQVSNFLGGTQTYSYTITVDVPANADLGRYEIDVYTSDSNSQSAPAVKVTYSATVTASVIHVENITVSPKTVTINAGSEYNNVGLTATISPSNATNKEYSWSSGNTGKVLINSDGWIRGVSATTSTVSVWATSAENSSIKDYCNVTVYEPGSITLTDKTDVSSDATNASMSISLSNINTSTLSISTGSASWISSAQYNSSTNKIDFSLSANTGTQTRDTTITVTGRDMAGSLRTDTATLAQYGADSQVVPLTSLSVNGVSSIGDDGTIDHRYDLVYNPTDTTETGVTWDVIDANTGNSVVGTLVTLTSYPTYCIVRVRPEGQANNANVKVQAVSNPRPLISAYKEVTVTYNRPLGTLTSEPASVNLSWNATSDDTPVITWAYETPTVLSFDGVIQSATLNSQTNRLSITCTQNTDPYHLAYGSVVLGGSSYTSLTIPYTQAKADNPYAHTSVNISDMKVYGNAYPQLTANVNLVNGNGDEYLFPDSFSWVLYGYESSGMTGGSQIASGTKTGYNATVSANSSRAVQVSGTSSVPTGNMTYFKLVVTIDTYSDIEAQAELSEPGSGEITG